MPPSPRPRVSASPRLRVSPSPRPPIDAFPLPIPVSPRLPSPRLWSPLTIYHLRVIKLESEPSSNSQISSELPCLPRAQLTRSLFRESRL
jgi:hypothetical protein